MEKRNKFFYLTLDFEEDLGSANSKKTFFCHRKSKELVKYVLEQDLKVTMFVTGEILEVHPHLLDPFLDYSHNFHFELHAYDHTAIFKTIAERKRNIVQGLKAYRQFFGRTPRFYRAPNGMISNEEINLLIEEGLYAGSNFFPTFFPGRFNNLKIPQNPFFVNHTPYFEIPVSVTKYLSIPCSLSYIKLIGWRIFRLLNPKMSSPHLVYDFHLHDLFPDEYKGKIDMSIAHKIAYSINGSNKMSFEIFDKSIQYYLRQGYKSQFLLDLEPKQISVNIEL
jgi:peptidoglycan/xylan/chitin deacetylase (PgdA/CDA1 family)